jgi:hypothetical protein
MDLRAICRRALLPFIAALALVGPASADEGLWTFDRLPRELIAQRSGVTLADDWLDRVRLASARLSGGCSATFISPRGLMITSRQCVDACLADNSTGSADLMANGFVSRNANDEKRCRRLRAKVLVGTEDVTGQVMLATSGLEALAAANARDRTLAGLEQACEEAALAEPRAERVECEPVALFDGGEYRLYKYRTYDDVRLEFAPERSVARVADASTDFPRHAFDVAFLRAYADGKPAATDAYLRVNFAGPGEREPLFVAGNPAATERFTTMTQLLAERDTVLADALLDESELKGRYAQFAESGPSARERIAEPLAGLEHDLRAARAAFAALLDEQQLAVKRSAEEAFKLRVAQDPELRLTAASAFDEIAAAEEAWRNLGGRRALLDGGLGASAGVRCRLCDYARILVRAGEERQKPDAERQPGFRAGELPQRERELASTEPVAIDVEILNLAFALERLRARLGAADPLIARVLGAETPRSLAERTLSRSRLVDPGFRQQLWSAGAGAIVSSDDPLIALTRELQAAAAGVASSWRQTVDAPERRASERLARARMKIGGASNYSDATGTLRLSSGAIAGWNADGAAIAPVTTLAQMYDSASAARRNPLPAAWQDARERINAAVGLDIAIDADVGAGCPGCGVVSTAGDLVGVVFDGNRRAGAGRYWFDAGAGRAIALDTAALKDILLKVYQTDELMKEIVVGR